MGYLDHLILKKCAFVIYCEYLMQMVLIATCWTSPVAQWMRLRAPIAGDLGSIPDQGTRSHMHAAAKSSHAATKKPACRN